MDRKTKLVDMLLSRGADVNATDEDGLIVLRFAKKVDQVEAIQLLKEAGAKNNLLSLI
jgi:ankyrin repeat protein